MKKFLGLVLISAGCAALPWACSKNNPTSPSATPVPPTATIWAGYSPTNTATSTATGTPTATVTATATSTATPTGTFFTPTSTVTDSPTITPTPTQTSTFTDTPTFTATVTPTNTFTPTSTFSTPAPSPSGTPWTTAYPPNGLAANAAGTTVYVAEGDGTGPGVVELFSSAGVSLGAWTNASFGQPYGVAVNAAGTTVYVVDEAQNAVFALDSAGSISASISSWTGGAVTAFLNPEGIALDSSGNVYVADTGNAAIEEFTPNLTYSGTQWSNWSGGSVTNFSIPSALAFDGSGNLYVADAGATLIDVFSAPGVYSNQWPTAANSDIFGITIGGTSLYAADSGTGQVEVYDASNGNPLTAWTGPYPPDASSPDGVVVMPSGDVLVADFYNNAVEKFGP